MELIVNGERKTVVDAPTVAAVLAALGYTDKPYAVAIDGTFLPRARHAAHRLEGGESLEILAPMQGG